MALEIDAAHPVPDQHDPIRLLRVRARRGEGLFDVQKFVVPGGRPLQGHQLRPPAVHPLVLAEEAVAADVHAVAPVADGLRDAADAVGGLQNGDGVSPFQQLYGGGQARGPRADDDDLLRFHEGIIPIEKGRVNRTSPFFTVRLLS